MKMYTEKIYEFEVGDEVDVAPKDSDTFHEFTGIVIGVNYDTEIISVRDQEDDVFDVDTDQLTNTAFKLI